MKKLRIEKLSIQDWCGIDNLEVDLKQINTLSGDNEVGKSSVASAITWVLSSTDIEGDTLQDVLPTHREQSLSPTVRLDLLLTNEQGIEKPATIEKTLKAGFSRDKQYTGEHKTVYRVNGNEYTGKKFQEFIILNVCEYEVFNMLSNIKVFTEKLKTQGKELVWEKQRRIVKSFLPENVEDYIFAKQNEDYSELAEDLLRHGTVTSFVKQLKGEQSELQKLIDEHPVKVETLESKLIDIDEDVDYSSELNNVEMQITTLEQENTAFKQQQVTFEGDNIKTQIEEKQQQLDSLKNDYNTNISKWNTANFTHKNDLEKITNEYKSLVETKSKYEKNSETLKKLTYEIYCAKKQEVCKECGRPFDAKPTQQDYDNYINMTKDQLSDSLKKVYNDIANITEVGKTKRKVMQDHEQNKPIVSEQFEILSNEINVLIDKLSKTNTVITDMPEYEQKKQQLNADKEKINQAAYSQKFNEEIENDIKTLKKEQKKRMADKSELQRKRDLCEEFIKLKCNIEETQINNMLMGTGIQFKLFELIKTTGEYKETFEIMFNGKEYKQLSRSTRIIVSYLITMALQKAYNVSVPILIDDIESVNFHFNFEDEQVVLLERIKENCPKCNGKSGRKQENQLWKCLECEHEWAKNLNINEV